MQLFDVHLGGEGVVEWLYTASKKCSTALLVVQLGTNSLYIYVCVCVCERERERYFYVYSIGLELKLETIFLFSVF